MKESIFNIYVETDDKRTLLFNSLFCGLCEVDKDYFALLKKFPLSSSDNLTRKEQDILKLGQDCGFFVEDSFDELASLRVKKYITKFSSDTLIMTIAPTLSCNFRCTYCYESKKHGVMDDITCQKLIEYLQNNAIRYRHVRVSWYGGEPLLAKEIVYSLSESFLQICEEHNMTYEASIITNGSLIDNNDVQLFKKYHIDTVQITLDGPPMIHNQRRICPNIPDNYGLLVNNINTLLSGKIFVTIRVNIDKDNINNIDSLLQDLSKRLINKNVSFGFAKVVSNTDACKSIEGSCYSTEEFSQLYFDLYQLIKKYGFEAGTPLRYARPKLNFCGADIYNSFVIDPSGLLYKCWHNVGEVRKSIGTVDNINSALASYKCMDWLFSDALTNEKCKKCEVLPLSMGGCPSERFYKNCDILCDEPKYNIIQIILNNYYNRISVKEDTLHETNN